MVPADAKTRPESDREFELARLVARTRGLQPWRRVFHALTGIVLVSVPWMLGMDVPRLILTLAGVLVLLGGLDLIRLRVPALNALFFRTFSLLASPRECDRLSSSTWYLTGVIAVYALFPVRIAIPAILVLAFADPAASVVGQLFGGVRVGKGTIAGGLTFLVVSSAVLLLGTDAGSAAILVAAVATTVEMLPLYVDDNLSIPLSTAATLFLVT